MSFRPLEVETGEHRSKILRSCCRPFQFIIFWEDCRASTARASRPAASLCEKTPSPPRSACTDPESGKAHPDRRLLAASRLEHFSIRLGVSRVREISVAFFFGNTFEKRGDCSPKLLKGARLHFA